MINPVSIQIAVVSHDFLSGAIKLVQMFYLKLLEINLNTVLETIIFGVCGCVLIELLYRVLVEDVMVSCLNLYAVVKEDF